MMYSLISLGYMNLLKTEDVAWVNLQVSCLEVLEMDYRGAPLPSPQRSRSRINVDNVSIFTTPRKLVHALQDPDDSDFSEKQHQRFGSPYSCKFDYRSTPRLKQNGFHENGNSYAGGEQLQGSSESVASTEEIPVNTDMEVLTEVILGGKSEDPKKNCVEREGRKTSSLLVVGFCIALLAILTSFMFIYLQDDSNHMVPT
ncbi:hypothetical protein OIU85_003620 [Salix viminalis]|uniref:Uncharacterized protein n=1 Tax=Salix viminalis TaxID=40686 RepID=A0A9Q0PZH9_SALVM|nr:hypothetical protein OIU85_003620 [Salix viminalis]